MSNIENHGQEHLLASCAAPIVWGDGNGQYRNGTLGFFNPEKPIAITNYHVYLALKERFKNYGGQIKVLALSFDLESRLIAFHSELDLATFSIKKDELLQINKVAAVQDSPYRLFEEADGVFVVGYPGDLRHAEKKQAGMKSVLLDGMSLKRINPSLLVIDREIQEGAIVEEFTAAYESLKDFGGFSGSPVVGLAKHKGGCHPFLGGTVFEVGEGFEKTLRARPISCVTPDGRIVSP